MDAGLRGMPEPHTASFSVGMFTPTYTDGGYNSNRPVAIFDDNAGSFREHRDVGTVQQGQPLLFIKNPHQINLGGQIALARDVDGDGAVSNDDIEKSTKELSAMMEKNDAIMGAVLAKMGYVPMIFRRDGVDCYVIPKLFQADGIAWVEDGKANLHDVNAGIRSCCSTS